MRRLCVRTANEKVLHYAVSTRLASSMKMRGCLSNQGSSPAFFNRKIDAIIVAPPTIWGTGQGQFNTHSIQVPLYIKAVLQIGEGIVLEDGINTWSIIHVADLSRGYLTIFD